MLETDVVPPEGWTIEPLSKCVEVLDNLRKPVNSKERAKRQGDVPYYGATGQVGWIDDHLFDEELVLLGEDGAPFSDKSKPIAYIINGKSWVNNHAHVLRARTEVTTNRYIKHYLDSFDFTHRVQGSTRDKLTQGSMNAIPVLLAPRPVQDALVTIIEMAGAQRSSASHHLTVARRAVGRFHQAVLAAACSGRLTADWRETHQPNRPEVPNNGARRPKQLQNIDSFDLDEIPEEWRWVQINDILPDRGIFDGPFGSNLKSSDYTDSGARVVRLENIGHLTFIDTKRTYVSEEKYRSLAKHAVHAGDIVFSSFVDERIRVCVLPDDLDRATIAKADCFTLRPTELIDRQYLALQMASHRSFRLLVGNVHGATRPRVNTTQVRGLPVPICSLDEQREIVRRIVALSTAVDALEYRIATATRRVDRSSQAVLAKAFRGELVSAVFEDR